MRGDPESASADSARLHLLAEVWNQYSGDELSKVKTMTPLRLERCVALWRVCGEEAYWVGIVRQIALSDFLTGKSKSSWRCTFDWFLDAENNAKIREGHYDNRAPTVAKLKTYTLEELDKI